MNYRKKKILSISFSDLKRDPRVSRQLSFLNDIDAEIHSAGLSEPTCSQSIFHLISGNKNFLERIRNVVLLITHRYERYYWSSPYVQSALKQLEALHPDIVIANDLETLPLALKLVENHNGKVFLDAHEYEPGQFTDRRLYNFLFSKYWDYVSRIYLDSVDAMTTVCHGISEKYENVYGVNSRVLTNAPFLQDLTPSICDAESIRLCHHGSLSRSRELEKMILLTDLLDERFSLDLMFIQNDPKYLKELRALACHRPKVKFVPPVTMENIPKFLNAYDIGLYLLSPKTFNCKMALPNKLFEYIQARLAIAIWPSPEMARVIEKSDCGLVSSDFTIESMAEKLNSLSIEEINKYKENSNVAARNFCAEKNNAVFNTEIFRLLA